MGAGRSSLTRVLLVEDDPSLRDLMTLVLADAGIRAVACADGASAREQLDRGPWSAILLDVGLPDCSGYELVGDIRARPDGRTVPILMVTGQAEVEDRVRGLDAGANDYLVKPVHPDELVARIRAQLRGQDAWLERAHEQLRERAAVGEALCRIRPRMTPEATARAICAELVVLRHVAGAGLVAFLPDEGASVLAAVGDGLDALGPGKGLPAATARRLLAGAQQGAWVEHHRGQPAGAIGPTLAGPGIRSVAYAPMRIDEHPLGLLVIATDESAPGDPTEREDRSLSAAIDFSAVAGTLLGPILETRGELDAMRARLAAVLREGLFEPVYQPIIDLGTNRTVGYEVLTRFRDGSNPMAVFSEAASLGMTIELETATAAAAVRLADRLPTDGFLSVNVSPAFLTRGADLPDLIRASARPVVLELTEHDPIDDYPGVRAAVRRLGSGVRLSVDDAGAGYACLHHILELQPAFVKLDRGWVTGIAEDPARQALVAGLTSFAERTGCRLIAEGIEEERELEVLTTLGVAFGQGFLLGRPASV